MNKPVTEVRQSQQSGKAEQGVPVGYKQTEVGVIPEDWGVAEISKIFNFKQGCQVPVTKQIKSPQLGFVRFIRIIDITTPDEPVRFIKDPGRDYQVAQNDLFMVRYGAPGLIGFGYSGVIANNLFKLNPKLKVDTKFYYHYLSFRNEDILEISGSSTMPAISFSSLSTLIIVQPDKKEQTAIANALSDVDALLNELEGLIAKKQAIKTATMQQLLTGRTHLPQFAKHTDGSAKGYKPSELGEIPEDWEVRNFGDLFNSSISRKLLKPTEVVSFVSMQDVSESAHLEKQFQTQFSNIKSGFTYFEKGDVLVAKITPCFENGKGCHTESLDSEIGFGSTEFHVLRANNLSDNKFIYFWTTRSSFRVALESEMVGSAGHRRVPFSSLQKYLIPCPVNKSEQTAIATILSNMDAEIQALEQRLAKTRDIKQGMMQQLLTGKIRLVPAKDDL